MQEELPRLARELRKETCPPRVIAQAVQRIAAETPPPSRLRYAVLVALAGGVLLCGLLVRWRQESGNLGRQIELVGQQDQADSRRQAARDAERALAVIGTVLLDARAQSETVISDRAIPPLRNGLETAKNKIIRYKEL